MIPVLARFDAVTYFLAYCTAKSSAYLLLSIDETRPFLFAKLWLLNRLSATVSRVGVVSRRGSWFQTRDLCASYAALSLSHRFARSLL